jgi:hypothetical protein
MPLLNPNSDYKEPTTISQRQLSGGCLEFACGMVYLSFFDQIASLDKLDPAPISSVWVAVIKGIFFLLAILGLIGSLREKTVCLMLVTITR